MENNINLKKVVLLGPGGIGKDYAKVLRGLNVSAIAIGRNEERCSAFQNETGLSCRAQSVEELLESIDVKEHCYIVAVNTENLGIVLRTLLEKGAKKILVEKPAGIDPTDIQKSVKLCDEKNATVFVAYNRRFYQSVQNAERLINEHGGLLSCSFEFTEWAHEIEALNKTKEALANWMLGNSSHVIDAAFFLAGKPKQLCSFTGGGLEWHPRAAQFSGAGVTEKGALFSYQANWQSAGRWGVELNTIKGKLVLRPMEKLFFMRKGQLGLEEIVADTDVDINYKPGLYKQVEAFLNEDYSRMISLSEHFQNVMNIIEKMNGA